MDSSRADLRLVGPLLEAMKKASSHRRLPVIDDFLPTSLWRHACVNMKNLVATLTYPKAKPFLAFCVFHWAGNVAAEVSRLGAPYAT